MTGIHTHPSISGAAAGRHQPSTRPSPGSRIPADTTTRRYARIPGNAAQMRTPKATPCTSPQTGPPEYRRIPRFLFAIRGTYHSECPDEHIPLPGIHRQRMRTWQQQRNVTGTMLTHTVDDRHVSCLCSRWEQSGVAGATLPRLDRLASQTLATAGLLDIQHQLQHTTGRQLLAEPIRRPRPVRYHTTRRKAPHARLPLTPHRRHLHRTTMRSLPHPQQAIHTTSRHHTPTQPRSNPIFPMIEPFFASHLNHRQMRVRMIEILTNHGMPVMVVLLFEIRRRRQHQHPIATQILTQRARHTCSRVTPITGTPRINPIIDVQ